MESNQTTYYKTPIGTAKIVGDNNGIQSISVLDDEVETYAAIPVCLQDCVSQLDEYFSGSRKKFNLKLNSRNKTSFTIDNLESNLKLHQLQFAHKFGDFWLLDFKTSTGTNKNSSQNFVSRNYNLENNSINPKSILYL